MDIIINKYGLGDYWRWESPFKNKGEVLDWWWSEDVIATLANKPQYKVEGARLESIEDYWIVTLNNPIEKSFITSPTGYSYPY